MILSSVIRHSLPTGSRFKSWFAAGVSVGNLDLGTLSNNKYRYEEYSGLTNPTRLDNKNYLWAIFDGSTNYILAIDRRTGASAGEWGITEMSAIDIEDCTSCRINGTSYLFICDVGDNGNTRGTIKVIRVQEPIVTGQNGTMGEKVEIICSFPTGNNAPSHKDIEAVMADPNTGDLYFITKRISPVKMYKLPFLASYNGNETLEFVTDLTNDATFNTISTTSSGNNGYVTGSSISRNGSEIIIRSYSSLYIWRRNKNSETIAQCLARSYNSVLTHSYVGGGNQSFLHPNQEPQGEAVSFDYFGKDIYTCSEYVADRGSTLTSFPLFKYQRILKEPITIELRNGLSGYSGCEDTYVDSSQAADILDSNQVVLDIDNSLSQITKYRIGLIKFNLDSIPTGSIITGCYLTIKISTEGRTISIHRVLKDWNENSTWGGDGGLIAPGNTEPGANLDQVFGVDKLLAGTGPTNISGSDITLGVDTADKGIDNYLGGIRLNMPIATVQGWIDGTIPNYGWGGVGGLDSVGDGILIESSESITEANRPKLTISYIP